MCKLVKEAEECSVNLNCDIIGATLNYRTAAAKDWLSRSRQVSSDFSLKHALGNTRTHRAVRHDPCYICP